MTCRSTTIFLIIMSSLKDLSMFCRHSECLETETLGGCPLCSGFWGRNIPVALRGESMAVPLQLCREDKPCDTETPIQASQGLLGRYWPVFSAEMWSDCT